jgi:hypothetical protein
VPRKYNDEIATKRKDTHKAFIDAARYEADLRAEEAQLKKDHASAIQAVIEADKAYTQAVRDDERENMKAEGCIHVAGCPNTTLCPSRGRT